MCLSVEDVIGAWIHVAGGKDQHTVLIQTRIDHIERVIRQGFGERSHQRVHFGREVDGMAGLGREAGTDYPVIAASIVCRSLARVQRAKLTNMRITCRTYRSHPART